jgi:hypothetical protein
VETKRVFISFDYDHDEELKNALVGQSKYHNSPFDFADWSVKEPLSGDWKEKVRSRIRRVDVVAVLCGHRTHTADGVSEEVRIAREEGKPYFLLRGRHSGICTKPRTALESDKVQAWSWENLERLIKGKSPIEEAIEALAWVGLGALGAAIFMQLMEGRRDRRQRFQSEDLATHRSELISSRWTKPWL